MHESWSGSGRTAVMGNQQPIGMQVVFSSDQAPLLISLHIHHQQSTYTPTTLQAKHTTHGIGLHSAGVVWRLSMQNFSHGTAHTLASMPTREI